LSLHPPLLSRPRNVADLVGSGRVENWIASGGGEKATTEARLLAAWLCWDGGQAAAARKLLAKLTEASGAAVIVATALDEAVARQAPSATEPADEPETPPSVMAYPRLPGSPPPAHPPTLAGEAISLDQWANSRGPLMGLPGFETHQRQLGDRTSP
jgi:hypothetical protein